MFLRVSLDDDPQGRQIADWLKSYPPKGIQEVEIEGLILKARSIEDLRTQKAIFSGSILGRLSQLAQIEILQRIRGISQAISKTAVLASEDDGGADTILHGNAAESAVNDIKNNILNVSNSVESGILLDPNIDLDEAANDEVVEAVGAEDAIALRQYLLDTSHIPNSAEIPRSAVKFVPLLPAGIKPRFRYGQIAEKPVLVEICQYTAISVESLEAPPATVFQLERMVQQLSHPKRTSFNILPCVGYIQERSSRAFGVVFDMDGGCNMDEPPVILSKFYALKRRVPLELRIQLAYTLAVALSNFHQVGWVHKELKSENVLFFKRALDQGCSGPQSGSAEYTDIDLTQPRLFGFECSRPEDAESLLNTDYTPKNNAYRHPQRWGKPMINFEKAHDVYALVRLSFWIFTGTLVTSVTGYYLSRDRLLEINNEFWRVEHRVDWSVED